jgi:hypothetical protein
VRPLSPPGHPGEHHRTRHDEDAGNRSCVRVAADRSTPAQFAGTQDPQAVLAMTLASITLGAVRPSD